MDKPFWQAIASADCALPEGATYNQLLPELLENLASPEAELRDDLSLTILSTWLEARCYTPGEMRGMLPILKANLRSGLGESGTPEVVRRTFSTLILAELIQVDNATPFLTHSEVLEILETGLNYLLAERDPRGYIPGLGWAHALAHTADLLAVLARSSHCGAEELKQILTAISARLLDSGHTLYCHDEDERLVNAVLELLQRDLVSAEVLSAWVISFSQTENGGWREAFLDSARNQAKQNVKTFLRSLYYRLVKAETPPPHTPELLTSLREGLKSITPWA